MQSTIGMIQIETTTACNAVCPMCPRYIQKRGHGIMKTDIFWKAVDQAVELGITSICPFINGEPLTDRRMLGFLRRIRDIYPHIIIGWYTNGSLLTEEIIRELLKLGNIRHFNISMQGGTKEVYEQNQGLSWERTVANVEMLIKINNECHNPVEVCMNMCVFSKTKDTVEEFKNRWGGRTTLCLGCYSNFGGMISDEYGEAPWRNKPRQRCNRALYHSYVYWNGDVGQCCFDLLGTITYGNLNEGTLGEIISRDMFQRMKAAHRNINVNEMPEICRNCNSSKFNG